MIVVEDDDGLVLFEQERHARLAGAFAAALVDVPEPRAPFVSAVREHDNGWREPDARPALDAATGRPHAYRDLPDAPYTALWKTGVRRALDIDLYVGLLVSLHGSRFFEDRKGREAQAFLAFERLRQGELLRALGIPADGGGMPEPVRAHFGWLRFLDGVSLFALEGWESPWRSNVENDVYTVERLHDGITVRPWPFTDPLEATVEGRRIVGAPFRDQAALDTAVKASTPVSVAVRLRPP